jgi:hypothetical protein
MPVGHNGVFKRRRKRKDRMKIFDREKKDKGILRDPMDPYYLKLIGAINPAATAPAPPEAGKPWSCNYHLFCNGGAWNSNWFTGALQMTAPNGVALNGDWLLRGCRLINDGLSKGRFINRIAADRFDFEVEYGKGIPVSWKTRQAMVVYDSSGTRSEISGTVLSKKGQLSTAGYTIQAGRFSKQYPRQSGQQIFTLEDSLIYSQLWPFDSSFSVSGELLEDFTVLREESLVYYDGSDTDPDGRKFHTFVMQGRGMLPFEFWMDEQHRPVACIQGSFGPAYIPAALAVNTHTDNILRELEHPAVF